MARQTKASNVEATLKAKKALELRREGYTLEEIAHQCGYQDKSGAFRAIKREMDRIPVDDVMELRKLEVSRLDELHKECWKLAMDTDNKARLFAVDRVLMIAERRAKLLGLDLPIESANSVNVTVIREVPQGYFGDKS